MDRNQWFASAGVFLAFALFAAYMQGAYTSLATATNLQLMFSAARMYETLTVVFFLGFFVCLVCGRFEKGARRK